MRTYYTGVFKLKTKIHLIVFVIDCTYGVLVRQRHYRAKKSKNTKSTKEEYKSTPNALKTYNSTVTTE